jgi:serine protease Do
MLSAKLLILRFLGGILLGVLAATPAFAGLSVEEINSIARQTTVLIAPGLTP